MISIYLSCQPTYYLGLKALFQVIVKLSKLLQHVVFAKSLCIYFLYYKLPHYYICIDSFIGCFMHLCCTLTTRLIYASYGWSFLPRAVALCVFNDYSKHLLGTGENNLLVTFCNLWGSMRSSLKCVKSSVPRANISTVSKRDVICCSLLEEIAKIDPH